MCLLAALLPLQLAAQQPGMVRGTVTRLGDRVPVREALVSLDPNGPTTSTDRDGRFVLLRVPPGSYTLRVRWLSYRPHDEVVEVPTGGTVTVDVQLEPRPVLLGEIVVAAASREPERVLEAPAAVSVVDPGLARDLSPTGQAPLALTTVPGVEVVQSGINEFNLNARGFNSTLNRRVLVLQDGRDLSIEFLGSQEWTAMSLPLEDVSRIELLRGPGSALYGANAFSGVLSISTPTAREVVGTKLSLAGGTLSSLRADLRRAAVFGEGRFGYRLNLGFARSDSWTRSRTNVGDLAREYAEAIDTVRHPVVAPFPGFEVRPLFGETLAGAPPGAPSGTPDPVESLYGSLRVDRYLDDGSVLTLEGGAAEVSNEVFITAIGRAQVQSALRPWARLALARRGLHLMAWYSGRNSLEPQYSLAAGSPLEERSHIVHSEAQWNRRFHGDRARIVLGASARATYADSRGTFILPQDDKRTDGYYSAYGQIEYEPTARLRLVGAGRWDDGDLFPHQLSGRGAIIVTPVPNHSIRLGIGRAFQTPATLDYLLGVPAGPPLDLTQLENGMRAAFGSALDSVPPGTLFTASAAVPIQALGNRGLDVERVLSYELGYKAQLGQRVFVTVDGYYSRLRGFVTDLLPGVNPTFAPWTAPAAVPAAQRAALEQAVRDALAQGGAALAAAGLTRLQDGSTAVVLSRANAGRATEAGVEVGVGAQVLDRVLVEVGYAWFDADVDSTTLVPGDRVVPNTPRNKLAVSVSYTGARLDARASARFADGYEWASGIFSGRVPSSAILDVAGGWRLNRTLRFNAVATNLLDQRRYQMFGGSIIGRRVLAGLAATF